ncbi:hypothetical protein An09g02940 [Aspergillus niger]|uniref:Uncharacterized protein n=2 Tax=Aspergillus niger TaxID=5061 RepID=A2QTQ6_ASPNC|nr:hypothetical protein An09g02940 [Aspergillus niger]CAK40231.1 hypothetical protein An09g02940 [Aspergillus niger]
MGEDYSANSQSSLTNELGEVPRGILAMPFPPSLKLLPWDREDDQIGRSALRGQLHVWVQVPATMDGRGNDWPGLDGGGGDGVKPSISPEGMDGCWIEWKKITRQTWADPNVRLSVYNPWMNETNYPRGKRHQDRAA